MIIPLSSRGTVPLYLVHDSDVRAANQVVTGCSMEADSHYPQSKGSVDELSLGNLSIVPGL